MARFDIRREQYRKEGIAKENQIYTACIRNKRKYV